MCFAWIAAIQGRKDTPNDWFSENELKCCPQIKRIMSGRKFLMILRGLHVEEILEENNPNNKIGKFAELLEENFMDNFEPGGTLSLDETLLRAFGRIKFKVRVITKAARHCIGQARKKRNEQRRS